MAKLARGAIAGPLRDKKVIVMADLPVDRPIYLPEDVSLSIDAAGAVTLSGTGVQPVAAQLSTSYAVGVADRILAIATVVGTTFTVATANLPTEVLYDADDVTISAGSDGAVILSGAGAHPTAGQLDTSYIVRVDGVTYDIATVNGLAFTIATADLPDVILYQAGFISNGGEDVSIVVDHAGVVTLSGTGVHPTASQLRVGNIVRVGPVETWLWRRSWGLPSPSRPPTSPIFSSSLHRGIAL